MKFAIDFEFLERGLEHPIMPISIGIAAEDGRTYYAVYASMDLVAISRHPWLVENVMPYLYPNGDRSVLKAPSEIRYDIINLVGRDRQPEFWGYFADYDWVLFCQTVGPGMLNMPSHFPQFCRDVKQKMIELGNVPKLPQEGQEHNALEDAIWTLNMVHYLEDIERKLPKIKLPDGLVASSLGGIASGGLGTKPALKK